MTYQDAIQIIAGIEDENYEPNEWEEEFIQGITDRWKDLMEKQSVCLEQIYTKATGGSRFQKREYFR